MTRDDQIAVRYDQRILVAPTPRRVRWIFDLATSDGHEVQIDFECSAVAPDSSADRAMLAEVLMGSRSVLTCDDVVEHFRMLLRTVIEREVAQQPAEYWIGKDCRESCLTVLRDAAKPVAFACGLELVGPFVLAIDSPTLRETRARAVSAAGAQRRASEQAGRMASAVELLRQFQQARAAAPELPAGVLFSQLDTDNRGEALRMLLAAGAGEKSDGSIVAVAGPMIVSLDAETGAVKATRELPAHLGPLRSARRASIDGRDVFIVGARQGLMVVDGQDVTSYALDVGDSPLGFSTVFTAGEWIYAAHAGVGLVRWALRSPDTAERLITSNGRLLAAPLNGAGVVTASGNRVASGDRTVFEADAAVVALLRAEHLIVVSERGTITRLDVRDLRVHGQTQTHTPTSAAALLPWIGGHRVLLATTGGPVIAHGTEGEPTTHYHSPHRGPRMVAASRGLIAAVSPDRQRIITWHPWDGTKPLTELHIAAMVGHRVVDVTG